MIAYVSGTLLETAERGVVVLTPGGVGYELQLTTSALARLPAKGQAAAFYTHQVMRMDQRGGDSSLELFGFETAEESRMFATLISVPKLGPRKALALLSLYPPDELRALVAAEDVAMLSRVPGLGKKTAQQVLFDLKFKLKSGGLAPRPGAGTPARGVLADTLAALVNLGYAEEDVRPLVAKALEADPELDVPQAVREALKAIARAKKG